MEHFIDPTYHTIFILRHGQTEWNLLDIRQGWMNSPLTEKGKQQARNNGKFLQNRGITHIFASPLGRAIQTAEIIQQTLQVPITIIPEFKEVNFGDMEGTPLSEVPVKFAAILEQRKRDKFNTRYPNGESYSDILERALEPMKKLLALGTTFAIVGHECMNRILRAIATGKPLKEAINDRQRNDQIVEIDAKTLRETLHDINEIDG